MPEGGKCSTRLGRFIGTVFTGTLNVNSPELGFWGTFINMLLLTKGRVDIKVALSSDVVPFFTRKFLRI